MEAFSALRQSVRVGDVGSLQFRERLETQKKIMGARKIESIEETRNAWWLPDLVNGWSSTEIPPTIDRSVIVPPMISSWDVPGKPEDRRKDQKQ
jgi:hypothetical protein